ncbi:DUF6875 domain-containing protein [Nocardia sp. NPDC052566]|uniref:DUF6875 domain-containing protein n=1 Tax=Nocardia sp. NPDC052566 TaxID=3364330 RepID=UPI0037CAD865
MTPRTRLGARTGLAWRNIYDDPVDWAGSHRDAQVLVRWVAERLIHPDPGLGRDGPVCPFVRQATKRRALWAAMVPGGDDLTTAAMTAAVDDAIDLHRALRDAEPENRLLATLTLFPGLTRHQLVDTVHLARKTGVVEQGLMLGQFYPGCAVSGLWNRDFHPLDAPVPMLVIRRMMNTDFPFLAARTEWLYSYLSHVAPDLPRNLRHAIADRLRVDEIAAGGITELRVHSPGEHAR